MAVFRIRFIATLQYREAALAGIATQAAWGAMEILAFGALYRSEPSAFPMLFSQTVSYIWLQQAFLTMFEVWYWESDISSAIIDGSIAYELARPLDLYGKWFCQASANRLARALLRSLPVLLFSLAAKEPYRLTLPQTFACFGMFLISAALGLGVVTAFSLIVYASLFYTISPSGIRAIISSLAGFLGGSIIPLPFFPAPVRAVAEKLPFACMQNMPLRIFIGDIYGQEAIKGIFLQAFWLLALVGLGKAFISKALSKVVVQGG
ncbi:MAG: ABC-2 family transporter protein [Eubacteriaceae bacterium]|nr:ABC-2 family transporter protein [Eubacteriaceae bacterium]